MKRWKCAALVAAVILGGFAPASATIITVTYTGQVADTSYTSELDGVGFFGPAGGLLAGLPFTAIFITDTTKGSFQSTPPPLSSNRYYGGLIAGTTSPTSLILTVGGHQISVDGSYESFDGAQYYATPYQNQQVPFSQTGQESIGDTLTGTHANFWMQAIAYDLRFPLSLTQPFSSQIDPINGPAFGEGIFQGYDDQGNFSLAFLLPTQVTAVVSGASPVPEPPSIALLIVSLAFVGGLRRRNMAKKTVVAKS